MKRYHVALLVIVALAVVFGLSVQSMSGGQDCQVFAAWDRRPDTLTIYPERVDGTYEHVELLLCDGGTVRATIREVTLTRQDRMKR